MKRATSWILVLASAALAAAPTLAQDKPVLMGIDIRPVGSPEARGLGVAASEGAVVTKVFPGYAAEIAGLKAGDVVIAVGEQRIANCDDLYRVIGASGVGNRHRLTVYRGPAVKSVEIVLGATVPPDGSATPGSTPVGDREPQLGVLVRSAGHPQAVAAGVESPLGAVLTQVVPGGAAAQAGLRRGDAIVEFAGYEIQTFEDLEAAVHRCPLGSRQRMVFVRGAQRLATNLVIASREVVDAPTVFRHSSGGFDWTLTRGWKVIPPNASFLDPEKAYDVIESTEGGYVFYVYRHAWDAQDARSILDGFASMTMRESRDAKQGRITVSGAPGVFVAYPYGERKRVVLYRITFIRDGKRYVVDVHAPPLSDPEKLPLPASEALAKVKFREAMDAASPPTPGPPASTSPAVSYPPPSKGIGQYAKIVSAGDQPQFVAWGDKVAVDIPAGTVAEATPVRFVEYARNEPTAWSKTFQPKFVGLFDISLGDMHEFEQPLTVVMPYDPKELRDDLSPEEQLMGCRWDDRSGAWVLLPTWVDEEKHLVVFQTDHLSALGVIAMTFYAMAVVDYVHSTYEWLAHDIYISEHCAVIYDKSSLQGSLSDAGWKSGGGGQEPPDKIRWLKKQRRAIEYLTYGNNGISIDPSKNRHLPLKEYATGYKPGVPLVVQDVASYIDHAYVQCRDFNRPIGRAVIKIGSNWAEVTNAPTQFESVYDRIHVSRSNPTNARKIRQQTAHEYFHLVQHQSFGNFAMTPAFFPEYQWFLEATAEYAACHVIWNLPDTMAGLDNHPYLVNPRLLRHRLRTWGHDPLDPSQHYEELQYDKSFLFEYLARKGASFDQLYRTIGGSSGNDLFPTLTRTTYDLSNKSFADHYRGFAAEFLLGLKSPIHAIDPSIDCAETKDTLAFPTAGGAVPSVSYTFDVPSEYSAKLWAVGVEPDPKSPEAPRNIMLQPVRFEGTVMLDVYVLEGNKRAVEPKPKRVFVQAGKPVLMSLKPNDMLYVLAANVGRDEDGKAEIRVSATNLTLSIDPAKVEDASGNRTFLFTAAAEGIPPTVEKIGYEWTFGRESLGLTPYPDTPDEAIDFSRDYTFPDYGEYKARVDLYDTTIGRTLLATAEATVQLGAKPSMMLDPPIVVAEPGRLPLELKVSHAPKSVKYVWTFDDGSPPETTDQPRTTHTFTQEKSYTIEVKMVKADAPDNEVADASGAVVIAGPAPMTPELADLQECGFVDVGIWAQKASMNLVSGGVSRTEEGQLGLGGSLAPVQWTGRTFRASGVDPGVGLKPNITIVGAFNEKLDKVTSLVFVLERDVTYTRTELIGSTRQEVPVSESQHAAFNLHDVPISRSLDGHYSTLIEGKDAGKCVTGFTRRSASKDNGADSSTTWHSIQWDDSHVHILFSKQVPSRFNDAVRD